jgi:hypothetical protein
LGANGSHDADFVLLTETNRILVQPFN